MKNLAMRFALSLMQTLMQLLGCFWNVAMCIAQPQCAASHLPTAWAFLLKLQGSLPLVTITSYEMMQRLTCDACKGRGGQHVSMCAGQRPPCRDPHNCMAALRWQVVIVDGEEERPHKAAEQPRPDLIELCKYGWMQGDVGQLPGCEMTRGVWVRCCA